MPVLEDDGLVLWESRAIMQYLAEKTPGQTVFPADPRGRAEVNRWLFWCAVHITPANAVLVAENFVKPLTGRGPADPVEVARGEALIAKYAPILDAHLANKTWVALDRVTLADFSLAAGFALAGPARIPIGDYAHLQAWLARVQALPAWQRTWERARVEGWEGVIAKRSDSVYEHRRSRAWLKMKIEASQELVVGGFTDPQGKRVGLGALLVGHYDGDDFVFAGKVGTGLDTKALVALRARLDALERPHAPFTIATGLPKLRAHWVEPQVVVQVGFMQWTGNGKLRHPRLLGLRDDKAAREVVREA